MRLARYTEIALASAVLSWAPSALGQTRAGPTPEEVAASRIRAAPILRESDVKPLTVYEWARDGVVMNAWPGDGKTPPYDAARLELRLYNLPTGQLRRLRFPKGAITPAHMNDADIVIYSLSGRQVQIVDEEADYDRAGDATFQPYGVIHHSETVVPAERLEFAFARAPGSGHAPIFAHASDTPMVAAADRVSGGVHTVALGPASRRAPANARFQTRLFHFPGRTLAVSRLLKGETLAPSVETTEKLVYVVEGRLSLRLGDVEAVAGPGDLYRMAAGQTVSRLALEDSEIVEIDGSKPPPR